MDKLIEALITEFESVHKDSRYIYPRRNSHTSFHLVFDIRLDSSNTPHRRAATVDVMIFNAGSPARTFRLIDKIERHFTDRLITTESGDKLKFDRHKPVTSQQRIDGPDNFLRIDLAMDVAYYPSGKHQPEDMQHSNYQ